MSWQKKAFEGFRLYAVTDLGGEDLRDFFKKAEAAVKGGVDILQLRSKVLSDRELIELGTKLRKLTRKHKCLFFVNDRADLARACDADGVHLGQDDLPVKWARKILANRRKFVGKSTHSFQQAIETAKEDVDYIGFGPLFSTPTKPAYKPVGLQHIEVVKRLVKKPFVVIGGIDENNVRQVMQAGAERIAVVRAIWGKSDVGDAVKNLKRKIEQR